MYIQFLQVKYLCYLSNFHVNQYLPLFITQWNSGNQQGERPAQLKSSFLTFTPPTRVDHKNKFDNDSEDLSHHSTCIPKLIIIWRAKQDNNYMLDIIFLSFVQSFLSVKLADNLNTKSIILWHPLTNILRGTFIQMSYSSLWGPQMITCIQRSLD